MFVIEDGSLQQETHSRENHVRPARTVKVPRSHPNKSDGIRPSVPETVQLSREARSLLEV